MERSNLHAPLLVHTVDGADQEQKDITRNISLKNIYGSEVNGFNEMVDYQKRLNDTFTAAESTQEKISNITNSLNRATDLMSQLAFNIGVSLGKTNEVVEAMNSEVNKPEEEQSTDCQLCYQSFDPLDISCNECQDHCQGCVECQYCDSENDYCSNCDDCQSCFHTCVSCNKCQSCFESCEKTNYCADCFGSCQFNNNCTGCDSCNVRYSYPPCTKCFACQGCVSCEKFDTGNVCGAANGVYQPCNNCAAYFTSGLTCQYHYGKNRCSTDNGTVTDGAQVYRDGERHGCALNWNCDATWVSSPCGTGYGGGYGSSCSSYWSHSCTNYYADCSQNFASSVCSVAYRPHVWGCSAIYNGCTAAAYDTLHECESCYISYELCSGCYSCYNPNDKFQLWDPCVGCHSSCYICNVTCNGCQYCDSCVSCFGSCNAKCNSCQSCYTNCTKCVNCQGCNMCDSCNTCQSNNTCAECEKCQECVSGCESCNSSCYSGCYFDDTGRKKRGE